MKSQLPDNAPHEPEPWDAIMQDVENIIMPGVVHWQSPHMHAYFPALTSWPSLLGDMLADAINCLGFTWASSPACTELEMCVMDWLCKALGLPDHFLHDHPESRGGGILQSTVSECTLVALLASRKDKILQMKSRNSPTDTHTDAFTDTHTDTDESTLNSTLIAYASDQAHSSVEKAGLISLVKIRFLETDEKFSLRGETLQRAIQEDRRRGLVPVMLCATLGSTGVCSFDCLEELGPICAREGLWLHVDAAYAGSAFLCPELRNFLSGMEYADSFVFNPSKWMMVHFDCTAFCTPFHLFHCFFDYLENQQPWVTAATLWNTQELLRRITHSGSMFLIPAAVGSKLIIRFTVTSQFTRPEDIHRDWSIIQRTASEILQPGRWPRPHALSLDGETEEETLWQEQEVETQHEPSMIDKHLVRQNQRRAIRSMSCSAELPPTRPDHAHTLKEAPPLGVLAKIPESPEGRRTAQKRLMKFHSVPSLPQVQLDFS